MGSLGLGNFPKFFIEKPMEGFPYSLNFIYRFVNMPITLFFDPRYFTLHILSVYCWSKRGKPQEICFDKRKIFLALYYGEIRGRRDIRKFLVSVVPNVSLVVSLFDTSVVTKV